MLVIYNTTHLSNQTVQNLKSSDDHIIILCCEALWVIQQFKSSFHLSCIVVRIAQNCMFKQEKCNLAVEVSQSKKKITSFYQCHHDIRNVFSKSFIRHAESNYNIMNTLVFLVFRRSSMNSSGPIMLNRSNSMCVNCSPSINGTGQTSEISTCKKRHDRHHFWKYQKARKQIFVQLI